MSSIALRPEGDMLVVKLEFWPQGDAGRAELVGVGIVANEQSGSDDDNSNYEVCLGLESDPDRPWRMGSVNGLTLDERNAWELLAMALVGCGLPHGSGTAPTQTPT